MRTPKAMRWWRKPCNAARAQRRIVEVAGSPARAAPYCTLNCSFIVKKCALCAPRLASLSLRERGGVGSLTRIIISGALFVAFVSLDDLLHQRVAHDILRREMSKGDSLNTTQDLNRLFQARQLGAPQIDLSNVACDHRGGAKDRRGLRKPRKGRRRL